MKKVIASGYNERAEGADTVEFSMSWSDLLYSEGIEDLEDAIDNACPPDKMLTDYSIEPTGVNGDHIEFVATGTFVDYE